MSEFITTKQSITRKLNAQKACNLINSYITTKKCRCEIDHTKHQLTLIGEEKAVDRTLPIVEFVGYIPISPNSFVVLEDGTKFVVLTKMPKTQKSELDAYINSGVSKTIEITDRKLIKKYGKS